MASRIRFASPSWVEGEERLPSALGARPWSLRHLPPDAGCGICATESRLSSLTPRDSEGGFVWEDEPFLRLTPGGQLAACPLWLSLEAPTSLGTALGLSRQGRLRAPLPIPRTGSTLQSIGRVCQEILPESLLDQNRTPSGKAKALTPPT
jgi:hypothetical protein